MDMAIIVTSRCHQNYKAVWLPHRQTEKLLDASAFLSTQAALETHTICNKRCYKGHTQFSICRA